MKKLSSKDAMAYLKEAVALDIPLAHVLMGYVYHEGLYTYNKNEKKSTMHFDKAVDLGFLTHSFSDFDARIKPKKLIYYRDNSPTSFKEGLIEKIFNVPDLFYLACGTDKEKEYILDVWKEYNESKPKELEIKKFSSVSGKNYVFIQVTNAKLKIADETLFFLITFAQNGSNLKVFTCNKAEIYAPDIMFIEVANIQNFNKQHLYYGPLTTHTKERCPMTSEKKITAFIKNAIYVDNKGDIPNIKEHSTLDNKDITLYILRKEADIFAEKTIYDNAYWRMMRPALIWDILKPLTQTIANAFGIAFREDVLNNILNIIKSEAHLRTISLSLSFTTYYRMPKVMIKNKDIITFIALKAFIDLCEDIRSGKVPLKVNATSLFKSKLRQRLSSEKKDEIEKQLLRSDLHRKFTKEMYESQPLHRIKHPISDKDMKGTPIRIKPLDNK